MGAHSTNPKVALLGNPVSGRGRGAAALDAASALLRERGLGPRVLRSERPGHAVELAREAAESGCDLLLVLGGDGTIRDATAGLLEAAQAAGLESGSRSIPMGVLPFGTGNDLARTLGLPRDPEAALAVALGDRERSLDLWLWNDACFLNVAGIGLDAAAAEVANRKLRGLHGTAAYVAALGLVLPRFRPFPLELSWPDGRWSGRTWVTAFANTCFYGGGMQIAPQAVPDDGLLDVVIVEDVSMLELARAFPGIFRGTHVRHPRVRTFRVEEVRIEAQAQVAALDGELLGRTPAQIRRAPLRIPVRVP